MITVSPLFILFATAASAFLPLTPLAVTTRVAFVASSEQRQRPLGLISPYFSTAVNHYGRVFLLATADDSEETSKNNDDGISLAADFFKALQARNIKLDPDEFLDDEDRMMMRMGLNSSPRTFCPP